MESVELDGVPVRYRLDGRAPGDTVLLINSLGADHRMWEQQVDSLVARHRVLRYDVRGQGGTDAPEPPYRLADLGGDAVGLLDLLGIDQVHVCGVSLGGLIALWVAIHRPQRLRTATYANTAARIGTAEGWDERIRAVRAGGTAAISEVVMERFFSPTFRSTRPGTVTRAAATLEEHDSAGYVGACTALRDADLRDEVGTIGVPSLVIGGTADVSTPPQQARWLAEHVPGAAHVELEGAGHLSNLEQPEAFNDALRRHVAVAP